MGKIASSILIVWGLCAGITPAGAVDPTPTPYFPLPPLTFTPVPPPTPYPTRTPFAAQYCSGGLRPNIDRCLNLKREDALKDGCCRILFLDAYSCGSGGKDTRFVGEGAGNAMTIQLPCAKPGADSCTNAALTHCEDIRVSGKIKPGLKTQIGAYLDLHFKGTPLSTTIADPILGSLSGDGKKGKIAEYYEGKDFKLFTAGGDPLSGNSTVSAFPKPACDLVNGEPDGKKGAGHNEQGHSHCGLGTHLRMKEASQDDDNFDLEIFEAEISGKPSFDQREAAYLGGSWIAGVKCHLNEVKAEIKKGFLRVSPMCLAAAYDVEEIQKLQLERIKKYFEKDRTTAASRSMCEFIRKRDIDSWLARQGGSVTTPEEVCGENSEIIGPDGKPLAKGPLLRLCYFEAARKMIDQGAIMQLAVCEAYARSDRQVHCGFRTSERVLENERNRKSSLQGCANAAPAGGGPFGGGGQQNLEYDWRRCDGVNWDSNIDGCHAPRTGPCFRKEREKFYSERAHSAFAQSSCSDPGKLSAEPQNYGGIVK